MRELRPQQIEAKESRAHAKNQQLHRVAEARIEQGHESAIRALRQEAESNQRTTAATFEREQADLNADYAARRAALDTEWITLIEPLWTTIQAGRREADHLFASWENPAWSAWQPPVEFQNAALFGHLTVKPARLAKSKPESPAEVRALPEQFTVPLLLTYPQQGSILFESKKTGAETAVSSINNIIFRLLSTTPPGKLSFTIFDPVGLGQSFAGLMHLADYAESYINSRIWTQTPQIEQKLAELNEHMEKVIQMYLRNEYPTIAEYNAQAGAIAEKYHFLVVAGFPLNFSETAARRLLNIAASGARCGVFTLIHWDHRYALPHGFVPDELRRNSVCLLETEAGYTLADWNRPGADLILEEPPSAVLTTRLLQIVGEHSRDTNRVEVPFSQVAPANSEVWSEDTAEELRVPIGRSGATKLQYLAVGRGTRQHALIAGKTGSGKSTLFHVIITNLGLWCSPDQVEFYLVDFKKGVEFKCYATRRLPHARVVAIESDREFGLSVLQRVDEELRHRGDLFRRAGVQDLPGYQRAGGKEPTPRCLLIIDEFQEFFVEEDRISQHAAVLLDRIVRQGRAFGIHVLLGSQTLGGAYTLARATLGQMVIRIALQCNEADAYLIMDENNAAPRLLSRPGEGIYNDAAGALQANSPFQTVWLPDEVRDELLVSIRARANASSQAYPDPIVFEGNAPADIRENAMLNHALAAAALPAPLVARIWLGAPNSIKGPTEAALQRQSGNNLLIVGQREEAALAMVAVALVCLAAQYPAGTARLILFESTNPNSPQREFLDRTIQVIPHGITRHRNADLPEVLEALALELAQRESGDQGPQVPPVFLIIHGLENFKKLRQEDEFSFSLGAGETRANPGATFVKLLSEGPAQGIHIIATCDTYNNVTRFLGRKALTEIAMRVLFQMSAADSASLAESPAASNLGLHRALFYNDQEGVQETFRPYAMPGSDWFDEIAQKLARLATIKT